VHIWIDLFVNDLLLRDIVLTSDTANILLYALAKLI